MHTLSVASISQAEASNNLEENKRDKHVSCCIESTLIINNDNNNISLISTIDSTNYSDITSVIISNNIINKKFTDFRATFRAQACCESHMTHK